MNIFSCFTFSVGHRLFGPSQTMKKKIKDGLKMDI